MTSSTITASESTSAQHQATPEALDHMYEIGELQNAAAVALIVLRWALVEGASVTREAITHEAAVTFGTGLSEAALRLDVQAQKLGVSSLMR